MSIAGELAKFLTGTSVENLPPLALERARMAIASTIASAAMGADIVSSRIIRELARERGGAPEATVWFDSQGALPVADAARVNAVMSDAAASDDSDLRSIAHIGTIVSTVAIATAERTGASGRDVLAAMVLGYEIAGRIDEALTPGRGERGFHGSISTIFGGAVAAGTLVKLTLSQMTQAIALAATSIGGLMVAANTSVAREYHAGLSAMLGVHAALAAKKGYVAEEHVLEMPRGFFSAYGGHHLEDVTKHLGASWDITTNMAIKLVPGGHPHHAAAEAAANAAIAGDVDPLDVSSIVLSSAKYRTLPGPKHPTDLIGVAHSPAYFVAAAIADRGYGWVHACPEKVVDPVIARLIDKIAVDPNPTPYPDRFAHHHGATVTITLGTAAGSPTTWIFRAAPLPAESIGPTWTPSTGNWCRCQGWRRKKSRPASRWCIASTPSRTCQSSRACYADGPQSAPPIELAPWACPATAGPSLPKRSMKEHEYGWDLER